MTTSLRLLYLLSLVFTTLALVPAGAHLMELAHKIRLGAEDYRTVQQIYRGWSLAGIFVIGALVCTLWLALALREQTPARTPAWIAFACVALTQVIFWSFTFPVNQRTQNWTTLPDNWSALRAQWEYSHAVSAILTLIAVVSLIVSLLRHS